MVSTRSAEDVDPAALRAHLEGLAAHGRTATYQEVAQALGLRPPHTIHRLTVALETLLAADVAAGRALLAAVVVSRGRGGLPAPGFFACLRELGVHEGADEGAPAAARHRQLLGEVFAQYGANGSG
jgi:hypothetical protein